MSTKIAFSSKSSVFVVWKQDIFSNNFIRAYNTTTWEQIWEIKLDSCDYDYSPITFSKSGQYFSVLTIKSISCQDPCVYKLRKYDDDELKVTSELDAIFVNVIKTLTGEIVTQFCFRPRLNYERFDKPYYVGYNEKNVVIVDSDKKTIKTWVYLYDLNGNLIKRFMINHEHPEEIKLENDILTYGVIADNWDVIGHKSVNIYTEVSTQLIKNNKLIKNHKLNKRPMIKDKQIEKMCPNEKYALCFNNYKHKENETPNVVVYDMQEQKPAFEIKSYARCLEYCSRTRVEVVSQEGFIEEWDLTTGKLKGSHKNPFSDAKFIFSHDSSLLAVLDLTGHVTIYKTATGEKINEFYTGKIVRKPDYRLNSKKWISWEDGKLKFIDPDEIDANKTYYEDPLVLYSQVVWLIDKEFYTGNSYDIVSVNQFGDTVLTPITACHRDGSLSYHHPETLETIQTLQASFIPRISS